MIPAETLADLATLGLSRDQADAVSRMLRSVEDATRHEGSAAIEARRKNDRDRKERQRHGKSRDVTGTDVKERDNPSAYIARAAAPVCSNDISNEISKLDNPLPTVGPLKSKNPTPQKILSEVVSEKTAADVIAHRKALRKPLTPRAAELLAKTLAASGDAESAAATMIERGWQGYRADWDTPRSNARAGPQEYPGTKKTEFMAFYEQLCEDTKGYGNQTESEISDGNVLSLPVVRHEDGRLQGNADELSPISPRIPAGNR